MLWRTNADHMKLVYVRSPKRNSHKKSIFVMWVNSPFNEPRGGRGVISYILNRLLQQTKVENKHKNRIQAEIS